MILTGIVHHANLHKLTKLYDFLSLNDIIKNVNVGYHGHVTLM